MVEREDGQVSRGAAEVYEEFFVPALFREWTDRLADAAEVRGGQRVLDVACGTGVLARSLLNRVGPSGFVAGVDINPGMLAVARRVAPGISWQQGAAEGLPFDDGAFDAVVSQFGLMFFRDRRATVREMVRVLRPGGRLAVAVWDTLDNSPGYRAACSILQRMFGEPVAAALRAPFALGDVPALRALFEGAGLAELRVETRVGTARFPSIRSWMFTDIKGWTLADMIDNAQLEDLVTVAERELARFVTPEGEVAFDSPAHIVSATGR